MFDLKKPLPTACKVFPEVHVRGNKRKRTMSVSESDKKADESTVTVCLRYNSMLYLGLLSDEKEMVIVEQPWMNILSTFPPALARRVYGT